MGNGEDIDVSRRGLSTILSALGGAAGLGILSSCIGDSGGGNESFAAVRQAYSGSNFLWVDTVVGVGAGTSLRTLSIGSDDAGSGSNPVAIVGGYRTPGDGGGGIFYWSNAPITDNAGTFVVPNGATDAGSTGPGWLRIYSGALNARWFGATANGTTADDAAIQAALAAAGGSDPILGQTTSGAVYLPAGRYRLSQHLTLSNNGIVLFGDGWQSVLVPDATVDTAIVVGQALVGGAYGVLRDFAVEGGTTCPDGGCSSRGGTAAGIAMYSAGTTKLSNLYITKCGGDGIRFDNHYPSPTSPAGNNDDAVVQNCIVTYCGGTGIQIIQGPDNNSIQIINCIVQNNGGAGLILRGFYTMVHGGDYTGNGDTRAAIILDGATLGSTGGNIIYYPYVDGASGPGTSQPITYNTGNSFNNIIYGLSAPPSAYTGAPSVGGTDAVILPQANSYGVGGLLLGIDNVVQSGASVIRGVCVTGYGNGVPIAMLFGQGDTDLGLWVYSAGTGGLGLGQAGTPFQAQFMGQSASAITVPSLAPGTSYSTTISVGAAAPHLTAVVAVKVGDIAVASFDQPLPAGVILTAAITTSGPSPGTPAIATASFWNVSSSTSSASASPGHVRVQVTAYG